MTASGAMLTNGGLVEEEPDSALAIEDLFVDGKYVGYIMVSPSGMKSTASVTDLDGAKHLKDFRHYSEAFDYALSVL